MARDWRPEIVRLIALKQAISDADDHGLWEHRLPKAAATADDLVALETHLGVALDPGYREFLTFANGWPSFMQSVDLFGVDELRGGRQLNLAYEQIAAIEEPVLSEAGLKRDSVLPIAATSVDLDLFVMPVADGLQAPPVIWLAGEEIDRFPSFEAFVLAMLEYNVRELARLTAQ